MSQEIKSVAHDLEKAWEEHCRLEFEQKDADATIETMVDAPYVNHIPTMTGGSGKEELRRFYRDHFIAKLPPDTSVQTISRTIGSSSLVEELIFKFTHSCKIDFLLPGLEPTGRYVEIATVAIVHFKDGKIASEHIYWDQASVLVQLGLLDPSGVPVCGVESSNKVVDKSIPFRDLDPPQYEVWRQDDNGNKFLVCSFTQEKYALEYVEELTSRGHKQVYWCEKK